MTGMRAPWTPAIPLRDASTLANPPCAMMVSTVRRIFASPKTESTARLSRWIRIAMTVWHVQQIVAARKMADAPITRRVTGVRTMTRAKTPIAVGKGACTIPFPVVEMEPRIPARPAMTEIRSVEMDAIASVFWNSIAPTIAFRKTHSPWMPWKNSRRAMELSSISSEIPLHCTETLAVGVPKDDDAGTDSGAVFVFRWDGSTWIEEQKITPEDAQAGDAFGHSVAINHNRIVVGAPREGTNGFFAGAAYVFVFDGTQWKQEQKLLPNEVGPVDQFGESVAISGTTVAVAAISDDDSGTNSGAVYMYNRGSATWSMVQKVFASDASPEDGLSASWHWMEPSCGGAPKRDDWARTVELSWFLIESRSRGPNRPHSQQQAARGDSSVSQSPFGDTVVAGAPKMDSSFLNSGAAVVFTLSGVQWQESELLTSPIRTQTIFGTG